MSDRLRKAIEAFTAEGPDDGPNDSAQERALAMLCDSMEDYNAEPVPAAWRWQAIKRNMTDYLKASADAAQELREAWEETQKPGPVAARWNTCAKCSQLVDCDDVHDGCEVVCLGCSAVNVVVEGSDGSHWLALQKGA